MSETQQLIILVKDSRIIIIMFLCCVQQLLAVYIFPAGLYSILAIQEKSYKTRYLFNHRVSSWNLVHVAVIIEIVHV